MKIKFSYSRSISFGLCLYKIISQVQSSCQFLIFAAGHCSATVSSVGRQGFPTSSLSILILTIHLLTVSDCPIGEDNKKRDGKTTPF